MKVSDKNKRRRRTALSITTAPDSPQGVVERIFRQPAAEGQALRRQWMEDLQLPVATIDDILNAGGKLPR